MHAPDDVEDKWWVFDDGVETTYDYACTTSLTSSRRSLQTDSGRNLLEHHHGVQSSPEERVLRRQAPILACCHSQVCQMRNVGCPSSPSCEIDGCKAQVFDGADAIISYQRREFDIYCTRSLLKRTTNPLL